MILGVAPDTGAVLSYFVGSYLQLNRMLPLSLSGGWLAGSTVQRQRVEGMHAIWCLVFSCLQGDCYGWISSANLVSVSCNFLITTYKTADV